MVQEVTFSDEFSKQTHSPVLFNSSNTACSSFQKHAGIFLENLS